MANAHDNYRAGYDVTPGGALAASPAAAAVAVVLITQTYRCHPHSPSLRQSCANGNFDASRVITSLCLCQTNNNTTAPVGFKLNYKRRFLGSVYALAVRCCARERNIAQRVVVRVVVSHRGGRARSLNVCTSHGTVKFVHTKWTPSTTSSL